tara:strand:+ start:150 stop:743 length:594 start_codon:yes stop_codon:yes gene_type:complete
MDSIEYSGDGTPYTIYLHRRDDQNPIDMFLIVEIEKYGLEHSGYCSDSDSREHTPYKDKGRRIFKLSDMSSSNSKFISDLPLENGKPSITYLNEHLSYRSNSRKCGSGHNCRGFEEGVVTNAWFGYRYPPDSNIQNSESIKVQQDINYFISQNSAPPRPRLFRPRRTTGRTYPVCRFYGTPNGCRNGDSCRFQHLDN